MALSRERRQPDARRRLLRRGRTILIERERIERQTQPRLAAPVLAGTVSTTACMGACPLMRPHLIVLVHLSIVVAPEGKRLREASASPKSRTYSRKPPRESRGGKLVLKLVAAAGARCTLDQCNEQEPLASRDPRGLHSCRYAPDRGHETMRHRSSRESASALSKRWSRLQ